MLEGSGRCCAASPNGLSGDIQPKVCMAGAERKHGLGAAAPKRGGSVGEEGGEEEGEEEGEDNGVRGSRSQESTPPSGSAKDCSTRTVVSASVGMGSYGENIRPRRVCAKETGGQHSVENACARSNTQTHLAIWRRFLHTWIQGMELHVSVVLVPRRGSTREVNPGGEPQQSRSAIV